MSNAIISVEDLGKRYKLGEAKKRADTAVGAAKNLLLSPLRNWQSIRNLNSAQRNQNNLTDESSFWAVRNVNFDICAGDVVGIIGRNGAGKSTLLKLLSRITTPTTGVIKIGGRISSLLEVGTGFHPELTGRENVYMNGTILGMTKREIDGKFDQIVDFSGVEKFLDTPVKRYSSGMQVRLAFSVAAHLEPEVLIVDEVLAVGDVAFQKKCMDRMSDLAKENRTILFVSHNIRAVRNLCTRVITLGAGEVIQDGTVNEGILAYQSSSDSATSSAAVRKYQRERTSGCAVLDEIVLLDENFMPQESFVTGNDFFLKIRYSTKEDIESLAVSMVITDAESRERITSLNHTISKQPFATGASGQFTIKIPKLPLRVGEYGITLRLCSEDFSRQYDICDRFTGLQNLSVTPRESTIANFGFFNMDSQII